MSHKITASWKGNMKFESTNPGEGTFVMDAAPESGGDGQGLRPKALILSSLAGCSGLDIAHLIKKMRLDVEDFHIDVEGFLTDDEPAVYYKVIVEYHFFGKELSKEKLKRAVELSVEKYCGVMVMFRKFAEVETKIIYHS